MILSSKYALIDPDDLLIDYEDTLTDKTKEERIEWSVRVYNKLLLLLKSDDEIYFYCGKKYWFYLHKMIINKKYTPIQNLRIGKLLHYYKANL